jgi:hypothetical protein
MTQLPPGGLPHEPKESHQSQEKFGAIQAPTVFY